MGAVILPRLTLAPISVSVSMFIPGKTLTFLNCTSSFAGSFPSIIPISKDLNEAIVKLDSGATGRGDRAFRITWEKLSQGGAWTSPPPSRCEKHSYLSELLLAMRARCPARGGGLRNPTPGSSQIPGSVLCGTHFISSEKLLSIHLLLHAASTV